MKFLLRVKLYKDVIDNTMPYTVEKKFISTVEDSDIRSHIKKELKELSKKYEIYRWECYTIDIKKFKRSEEFHSASNNLYLYGRGVF